MIDFLKKKPDDKKADDKKHDQQKMRWSPNLRRMEPYTGQPEGAGTPGTDPEEK